jgi:hypothetical protein
VAAAEAFDGRYVALSILQCITSFAWNDCDRDIMLSGILHVWDYIDIQGVTSTSLAPYYYYLLLREVCSIIQVHSYQNPWLRSKLFFYKTRALSYLVSLLYGTGTRIISSSSPFRECGWWDSTNSVFQWVVRAREPSPTCLSRWIITLVRILQRTCQLF